MKNTKKIIYWHRLGFKIYSVDKKLFPQLEKEVDSNDLLKIESELKYLSGQNILLLLSDSISYFYEKTIDPPLVIDNNFKNKLLEIIKSDIPEDFSQFNWDFKITNDPSGKQKVVIFAPVKEFQKIINQVLNKLSITIDAIEPESVAVTRDPNPIIGIFKKTDIKGKDENVLNLLLTPSKEPFKNPIKKIILILIFVVILIFTIFLIIKFKNPILKTTSIITSTPSPTLSSVPTTITPTPTIKVWSDLTIMVQNGTDKIGLATKTATIFKNNGINQVNVGNADSNSYPSNKLIFKNTLLQETYQNKFKEFLTIKDDNISIDNEITYDVILIIGIN